MIFLQHTTEKQDKTCILRQNTRTREQLKIIRQQLKQKISQIDSGYEDGTRLASMRENRSSFPYREPVRLSLPKSSNGNNYKMLKGNLEQAAEPRQIQVYNINPEIHTKTRSKQKESQISSYRKLKISRLQSLPSKSRFSRARLLESPENSFEPFFLKIPKSRQNRSNSQLLPAVAHLQEHNKLFSQLDQYMSLCLLRIGFYHELNPHQILYGINYDKSSIYIILSGVICLLNPNIGLKKMLFTGQTLGEQMLFGSEPIRSHLQIAKSIKKSYVLEIRTGDFVSMSQQLAKLKSIRVFTELQEILRDGFTQKNIARNEHLLNRKIRMKNF